MPEISVVILAAGAGKRMKSDLPKVLHPLCGLPMIEHVLKSAHAVRAKQTIVVASKKSDPVSQYFRNNSKIKIAYQGQALGTGHAVHSAEKFLKRSKGYVVILYGDDPLVKPETLRKFVDTVVKEKKTLGFVTAILPNPFGLGRIVRNPMGDAEKVVEEKEATEEIKKIKEINTGIYCVQSEWLLQTLKKLEKHPVTGEYYLTDIVEEAIAEGVRVLGFVGEDPDEFCGINNRKELARADEIIRGRLIEYWFSKGVAFIDPRHVYLDATVTIGEGSLIYPQTFLYGKTKIGKNCLIDSGSILRDMVVGDGVTIKPYCVLEESVLEKEAVVGPFARLRPHSHVGPRAHIGNFVELKKTKIGKGAKANHLSYLGDAVIGEEANIGCGTITCNYDGVKKYPTKIGKKVFVGSDVSLVAPVTIGDGATIGAGSIITDNVPPGALAIARQRQINKKNWAKKRKK